MTNASFVHLHNHTEYSMLDGLAKVGPMFAEAERLGMPAVGMTDHGNMYGAAEFFRESQRSSVKPIIGIEAYIAPESRFSGKRVFWGDPGQKSDDVSGSGAFLHMTLFAANAVGLRNLFRLSSRASFEGQLGKWPRMDAELVAEHAEGYWSPQAARPARSRPGYASDNSMRPTRRRAAGVTSSARRTSSSR